MPSPLVQINVLRSPDPATILRDSRKQAVTLATQTGVGRMRSILKTAQADLTRRLETASGLKGPGPESFTAAQLQATLAQVRAVLGDVVRPGIQKTVLTTGNEVAGQSAQDSIAYMDAAERRFTGINQPLALHEATVLDRAARGTESSLLHRLQGSPQHGPGILARYGAGVVENFEGVLQQRFIAQVPWGETRDRLTAASPFLQGAPAHWAERIVRTEVMAASNRSAFEAMQEIDEQLGGDGLKILCATFDNRTACLLGSARVTSGVVRAVFRRRYEGRVLRLRTKAGRDLTTTPNHPMLTTRGWVRADGLRPGDDLICDRRQENSGASGDEHVADCPPTIGEVFDSLAILGDGERRRGRQEDFHGDGMDGDVDVLRPDGELRLGCFTAISKPSTEQVFSPSDDLHFCPECGALLGSDASEELVRVRAGAQASAGFQDALGDHRLHQSVRAPDALERLALGISLGDLGSGEILSVTGMPLRDELQLCGFGVRSGEPSFLQSLVDVPSMSAHLCSHFRQGQAGLVELDRLVDVQVSLFCGHVFNLSTGDGYFTANSIYTGNCDSYAVHGQIRRVSEPFDTWQGPVMTPPARPNDREVVVPHRMSWPIPANLKPRSAGEVAARWESEGRKGGHPPIPRYSTVDVDQIGKVAAPARPSDASPGMREPVQGGPTPLLEQPHPSMLHAPVSMPMGVVEETPEISRARVASENRQDQALGLRPRHATPEGLRSLIWNHADEKDSAEGGFARMRTDEIAKVLGVSVPHALRQLQAAAKEGFVNREGRQRKGEEGTFQGQVAGRGGFQVWGVPHPSVPPKVPGKKAPPPAPLSNVIQIPNRWQRLPDGSYVHSNGSRLTRPMPNGAWYVHHKIYGKVPIGKRATFDTAERELTRLDEKFEQAKAEAARERAEREAKKT